VSKADAPATWDDLLKPRFKGKLAWSESTGTGAPFMITYFRLVLGEEKGLEYLKKLAAQDIRMVGATARLVLDQVIAGEYEVGVSMSVSDVADSMAKGAPVMGVLPEPVLSQTTTVQFVKGAPHPHAAALFIDFLASKDGGQQQLRDGSYTPAHPQVEPLPAMRWTVPRLNGKKEMVEDAARSQEMQASSADILSKLFK
jgi:ABC-type Fe3+ transport system substrate-binding protein